MANITSLKIRDILRIEAVDITPDGSTVVLGGRRGAGKSSILKSILLGFQGKTAFGKTEKVTKPIRDGAKKGEIEIEIAELDTIVKLTITPSGERLVLTNLKGMVYPGAPRERLKKLLDVTTFNPMALANAEGPKQTEMLMGFLGLDFADLDEQHAKLFAERREINSRGRDAKGVATEMPWNKDAPEAEVDPAELLAELKRLQDIEAENKQQREKHRQAAEQVVIAERCLSEREAKAQALSDQLLEAQAAVGRAITDASEQRKTRDAAFVAVEALVEPDTEAVEKQIAESKATNRKVRANAAKTAKQAEVSVLLEQSTTLTEKLDAIRDQKRKRIADAESPVEGLDFGEDGAVLLNGIPFSQASHTEQNEVSAAFMAAANPTLGVFLIPDGSTLDEDGLKFMSALGKKHGCQLWIEDCRTTDANAIHIVDGRVAGVEAEEGAA